MLLTELQRLRSMTEAELIQRDLELKAIERVQTACIKATQGIARGEASLWASDDHYRGQMAWDEIRRVFRQNPELLTMIADQDALMTPQAALND